MTGPIERHGAVPFVREVPYRLHLPGGAPAPLLVALHGKGDRAGRFEEEARDALPKGWGLLVPSAPIPRDARPVAGKETIGGSWYLYDGDTEAFRASLARAEEFLVEVVGRALATGAVDPGRVAVLGFSQGGYLAGVAAVRRRPLFRAAVIAGGRLKVEALGPWLPAARGLPVLGLHGARDTSVRPGPARESIDAARAAGLEAGFREFDAGHEFSPDMRREAREWLRAVVVAPESNGGAPPGRGAPPVDRGSR